MLWPTERAAVRHDRLDQAASGAGAVELEELIGARAPGRGSAAGRRPTVDDADEHEPVVGRAASRWGPRRAAFGPSRSISARYTPAEVAQAGLFDGPADQGAFGLRRSSRRCTRGGRRGVRAPAVRSGSSQRREHERTRMPMAATGHADPGDVEQAEAWRAPSWMSRPLTTRLVLVPMRVHGPAEDGGVAQREQQLRGRQAVLLAHSLTVGNHHGDHGRVVEEGAHDGDREPSGGAGRPSWSLRPAQDALAIQCTAPVSRRPAATT